MEQVTLTVKKIGSDTFDSEQRIFNAAQMNNVREVGGDTKFEYPFSDKDGLLKHQTVTVDETFAQIEDFFGTFATSKTVALTATGAQAISVDTLLTIVDGVTTQASGNRTLDLTVASKVPAGARLLLKTRTAGTQTTIFGTAIDATTITGEAGKTFTQLFIFDGATFLPAGGAHKID
jgi:hypothetical protein